MRKIEKLFLTGCGYSVLILTLFYLFAALTNFVSPAITTAQFTTIVVFGMIISLAELLYNTLKIKKIARCFIHYAVLFVAFFVIFIIIGKTTSGRAPAIFIAIVLYTILYFTLWLIIHLVRKTINTLDDKIDAKAPVLKQEKKSEYKPLYKTDK